MRPRVIPVLLVDDGYLVKTRRFKSPRYLGDPINTVRIFNDKGADELVLVDLGAARRGTSIDLAFVEEVASEAFMPVTYGGGISALSDARSLFNCGVDKILVNSSSFDDIGLVREVSAEYGAQAIVGGVDWVERKVGRSGLASRGRDRMHFINPRDHAMALERAGVGELLVTAVERDGTRNGYDTRLTRAVAQAVTVPVIANGGASGLADIGCVVEHGASTAAASSMFVYHGRHDAVLITYPTDSELDQVFETSARSER